MSSRKENVNKNSKQSKPEIKKPLKETTNKMNVNKKGKEKEVKKQSPSIEKKGGVKQSETKGLSLNKKEAKEDNNDLSKKTIDNIQPNIEPEQAIMKRNDNNDITNANDNTTIDNPSHKLFVDGNNNNTTHLHEKDNTKTNEEDNNNNANEYEDKVPEGENHMNHILKDVKEDLAIKPRENYLKAKIEEMNLNHDLLSSITKGLNNTILSIKDGFITSQLRNIPIHHTHNEVSFLLNATKKTTSSSNSNSLRLHCIKELKSNEASLLNHIHQLNENQKVLENESLLNLSIASSINPIDESLKKTKIQSIKAKKELIKNHLEEVKQKINSLVHEETIEEGDYDKQIQNNLHKFEVNFEKDKAKTKKMLKKLHNESVLRQQKMHNDLGEKYGMKANEIERKQKEDEQRKMVLIEQLRQQEKDVITKRTQINKEKYIKMKNYINNKFQSKSYAYLDLSKKYTDNENQLIEKERIRRKEMMKHIDNEELNDFEHKISIEKSKIEEELYEKAQKLKELWIERSKLKPEYVNPLYIKQNEEKAINEAIDEEKEEKRESNREKKRSYGQSISQPKPNPRLMVKRLEHIRSNSTINTNNSSFSITPNIKPIEKKAVLSKSITPYRDIKKKASTPENNLDILKLKGINEIDMKNYKIPKPTKLIKKVKQNNQRVQNTKPIDYLLERRKENRSLKETDWEKVINNEQSKSSLKECMMNVHDKTIQMDEKIKQKNQLLKLNGGVSQHPDICEEVSNLMINSIKAKLSIIDKAVAVKETKLFYNE